MSQHHLDDLFRLLTEQGWKLTSSRTADEYPYDAHAWTFHRGSQTAEILFDRFGGLGEDLPLLKSPGCELKGHPGVRLSFTNSSDWLRAAEEFVIQLSGR